MLVEPKPQEPHNIEPAPSIQWVATRKRESVLAQLMIDDSSMISLSPLFCAEDLTDGHRKPDPP